MLIKYEREDFVKLKCSSIRNTLFFNSSVASAATNNRYSVNNTIRQAPNTGDAPGGWGITPGHTHWG